LGTRVLPVAGTSNLGDAGGHDSSPWPPDVTQAWPELVLIDGVDLIGERLVHRNVDRRHGDVGRALRP